MNYSEIEHKYRKMNQIIFNPKELREMVRGTIDIHVHAGPSVLPRLMDDYGIVQEAQKAGLRAIVLKSHFSPTTVRATLMNKLFGDIEVFGGIVLNQSIGGLNLEAVRVALKLGCKVIFMPTISVNDVLVVKNGHLVSEAKQILDLLSQLNPNVVLTTGHLMGPDALILIEQAKALGINKIIVHHPLSSSRMSLTEQKGAVSMGAYIEHTMVQMMPLHKRIDPEKVAESIRSVGVKHCILSTDFGQVYNPSPSEGMRMLIATMAVEGFSSTEIQTMVKQNPANLLGLLES